MELRIKEVLKEKGLTSVWLASQIGITQPNTSNIVSGKSKPSLETLEKIASALNVSIIELFEANTGDLTALIDFMGKLYRVNSIYELESLILQFKGQI
ncbi:transcriptional regulator [Synergistales bacterium]|nr:transcriptional regulator [Synergistales bacterium]